MMDMESSFKPSGGSERFNGGSDEDKSESPEGPDDDFTAAIKEAMPDADWTPERVDAMRSAIRFCIESDYEDKPKEPGKDRSGLALIFGGPPGKSKK